MDYDRVSLVAYLVFTLSGIWLFNVALSQVFGSDSSTDSEKGRM